MKNPVFIFDFDGTLADTFKYLLSIGNELAREFNFKPIEPHQIEAFKNKTIRQALRDLEVPVLKLPLLLLKGKQAQHNRIHEVKLFDGLESVLRQLNQKNVQMGIVSTNNRENIQTVLNNHNLNDTFAFIGTASGFLGKPRALKKAITQHNLNPDQILYVGDEVRDIEAARQIGLSTASVTWGYNSATLLQAHHPDHLIHHPQELLQTLEKLQTAKR